jgi:hypothetical protein
VAWQDFIGKIVEWVSQTILLHDAVGYQISTSQNPCLKHHSCRKRIMAKISHFNLIIDESLIAMFHLTWCIGNSNHHKFRVCSSMEYYSKLAFHTLTCRGTKSKAK